MESIPDWALGLLIIAIVLGLLGVWRVRDHLIDKKVIENIDANVAKALKEGISAIPQAEHRATLFRLGRISQTCAGALPAQMVVIRNSQQEKYRVSTAYDTLQRLISASNGTDVHELSPADIDTMIEHEAWHTLDLIVSYGYQPDAVQRNVMLRRGPAGLQFQLENQNLAAA